MSALKSKKQFLLLPLIVALLIGVFALFQPANKESAADLLQTVATEGNATIASQLVGSATASEAHPADCAHCNAIPVGSEATVPHVLTTQPALDYIFKGIASKGDVMTPRSTFDLKGSQKGQHIDLNVGDLLLSGTVLSVLEDPVASAYAIKLDNGLGRLLVDVDGNGEFFGRVVFFGDSRALTIQDHMVKNHKSPSLTPMVIVEEVSISDLYCAPKGAIYTAGGLQQSAGNKDLGTKAYAPFVGIAEAIALDSIPGAEFVIYLDFDGEEVSDPRWLGGDLIDAQPHPKANDDSFVTSVWQRAAEDFAPFDITVTTDVSVYNSADVDKRLHVVITPTNDAAPGAGGVAGLFSFRSNSPIVWVFNLSEYTCATTISHEAGHAFGLFHDGQPTVTYYPGHNSGFTPGWAPIMGAAFSDGFYDEVDQWSKGEYNLADNAEDDLLIISGTRNGFGYKEDDYSDTISGNAGTLETIGRDLVGGSGLISRSNDVDFFRFATTDGDISLTVTTLDVESTESQPGSSTQGSNLAVQVNLLDATGVLVATGTADGPAALGSKVEATVAAGIYYITVEGAGRGADPAVGFSDYASLGAYTIVGALPTPPLTVTGGEGDYKHSNSVLLGDVETQEQNGTDFGFSYIANDPIEHIFYLKNTDLSQITNVTVSLASGNNFFVSNQPQPSIDGESTDYTLRIAYDPENNTGVHTDTVIITYDAAESDVFEFAVSGTSTKGEEEDNYWRNDIATRAADLNLVEDTWLSDYKGQAFFRSYHHDFYTFNVDNDELVTVEVAYDNNDGVVTFELRNGVNNVLGTTVAENGIIQFRVPDNYSSQQKHFYICAYNTADSSVYNAYDLRWSSMSFVIGDDDFYEENDSLEEAFDLTGAFSTRLSEYLGEGISKNEDWYKIEIPEDPFTRFLYVAAEFTHADGDINIEVIDENGISFFFFFGNSVSDSENDHEVISVSNMIDLRDSTESYRPDWPYVIGVDPGTYYIRVYGDFAGNSYDLVVEPRSDDTYEIVDEVNGTENDTMENAFDLGDTIVDHWLSEVNGIGILAKYGDSATAQDFVYRADQDWFTFTINPDAPVEEMIIEMTNSIQGLAVVKVFDSEGELLASNIVNNGVFFSIETISILRPEDSTFFIQVYPFADIWSLNGYDFRVTLLTDPPYDEDAVEDNYEENDSFHELFDLTDYAGFWLASVDGLGTQLDPDWFEISIPEGAGQVIVDLTLDGSAGNMDLTLSHKDGAKIFTSTGGGDSERIIWNDPIPGSYAVTVTGDRRGNNYNLFWEVVLEDDNYEKNDNFEENDERAGAYDLSAWERNWLRKLDGPGVQRDEDWYKITVPANTAELDIRTNFNPLAGDIDLELYNPNGFLVARSISQTDIESLTYSSPAGGDYYIQIHYENAGNEYDLWWAAFTQEELDSFVEDGYESNNSFAGGYVLTDDQVWFTDLSGLATQTDDDWFEITIEDDNTGLDVDVTFTHADGDIDVEVYDSIGSIIIRSESQTDNEFINYNAPLPAGTYQIRVYGANLGNEYDLYWLDRHEDVFEPNDTLETAYDLSNNSQLYISAIGVPTQGDDDWYKITADAASTLIAVQIDFVNANGNIDLELYNGSGGLLADSTSSFDSEYLQGALGVGTYYIRVFGEDLYNDYDLIWNAAEDDAFEDNEVFGDAWDLTLDAGIQQAGIQFDDDWYTVETQPGEVRLLIDLTFTDSEGNIDFEIYDASNVLLVTVDSDNDNESITYGSDPLGGTYYIRVYGDNFGNAYGLTWESLVQDAYEENDNSNEAYDLRALESTFLSDFEGHGSSLDEDWYTIEHVDTELFVEAIFTHADGNIDIELFTDINGQLIRVVGATSETDDETIIYNGPAAIYYLKVFGDLDGNTYDLIWNSLTDDGYEDNDDSGLAASLDTVELEVIPDLVQLDEDWYSLTVAPGDDILRIECLFAHSEGNVALELWDSTVTTSIAFADSETDNEDISELGLADGLYYLHVSGRNAGTNYTLRWNSTAEDAYEPNDDSGTAASLSSGSAGVAVPGVAFDEDWFSVSLPTGSNYLFVDLTNVVAKGDLNLAVHDASNNLLAEAVTENDDESIALSGLDGGLYYIQVSGDDFGNDYSLLWRSFQDDSYEVNNEIADAYDFSASPDVLLSVAGGSVGVELNDDYYRVVTPKDSTHLTANLTFLNVDGNLELEILDGAGSSIQTVNSGDDNEALTVSVAPQALTYYIKVSGPISGNTYDLTWSTDNVDNYEVNDTGDLTAFDISSINGTGVLSSLDTDNNGHGTQEGDDWYQLTVPAGQVRYEMELNFINEDGNIDVELLDSSLASIATAATTENTEVIDTPIDPTETLFYIRITGDNLSNSYDFSYETTGVDAYEINNFIEQAYDLSDSEGIWIEDVDGYATQFNDDWYLIVVSETSVLLTVDCEFTHAAGDIDIELYQLDLADPLEDDGSAIEKRRPKLIERQQTLDDNEQIVYDVTASGLYYIRGYQGNAGNPYRLRWDDGVLDLVGDQVYLDEEWEFGFLATAALNSAPADLNQNDDGDRYPNWAEFALGLDEDSYDQAIVTQYTGVVEDESYYFVEYVRTKEAAIRGYRFTVEESYNLSFDGTAARYVGTVDISENVEKVVYRSTLPVDEADSCFFRLEVEEPAKGH
jgi:hypothetical protein